MRMTVRAGLFLLAMYSVSADYVPGTPGGAWTKDELLVVRAKLWRMIADKRVLFELYKKIPSTLPKPTNLFDLNFLAAKLLRLSFHDCVKYEDGSGGCDGCLNWQGVGQRFPPAKELKYKFKYPDHKATNNNGLEYVVAVLEELYTNADFPAGAPKLEKSLKSSGKSRADLWSYAAKVAVEFSVEQNNFQCLNRPDSWKGSYPGPEKDCHRSLGKPGCEVVLPREIKFQYGRKDCISTEPEQYKAAKEEVHPNPEGNGSSTLDFFSSQFNFNGRETVAIMGAHTLGRMYPEHSLYKYTWTSRGGHMFNNAYYKNIVGEDAYFISSYDNDQCLAIGDANGKLPDVKWTLSMNGFTKSGGPMHWIKMHFACPQCTFEPKNYYMKQEFKQCCVDKPVDKMCKPDGKTRNDRDDEKGCERYRFAFGLDEMAINAEMGLYLNFDEVNGIPTGCPGFEKFNMETWKKDRKTLLQTSRAYHHGCGKNMEAAESSSGKPVYAVFEDYAANQATWVKDFVAAFEKMMRNGYQDKDLVDAPLSSTNTICTKKSTNIECH